MAADLKIFCEGIEGMALSQINALASMDAYSDSRIVKVENIIRPVYNYKAH